MTDIVEVALISAAGGIFTGLGPGILAAVSAHAARRAAERAADDSAETKEVSKNTIKLVDGRMSEVLELTRKLARIDGITEERAASAARSDSVSPAISRQEKDSG